MEGFISSSDGGQTWTAPTLLAGPMSLNWLPTTSQGLMVGDFQSLSFAAGGFHPVFALAKRKVGNVLDEAMYSPVSGLVEGPPRYTSDGEKPVPNTHSDHRRALPRFVCIK